MFASIITNELDQLPAKRSGEPKNRLLISGLKYELNADQPAARVLWPESRAPAKRILSNTSTPMMRGDDVYSAKSNGELVCREADLGFHELEVFIAQSGKNFDQRPIAVAVAWRTCKLGSDNRGTSTSVI